MGRRNPPLADWPETDLKPSVHNLDSTTNHLPSVPSKLGLAESRYRKKLAFHRIQISFLQLRDEFGMIKGGNRTELELQRQFTQLTHPPQCHPGLEPGPILMSEGRDLKLDPALNAG